MLDAIQLSRATFGKIKQNLWWAFGYNLVGIPLAAGALLPSMGVALTPSISGMAATCTKAVYMREYLYCVDLWTLPRLWCMSLSSEECVLFVLGVAHIHASSLRIQHTMLH